MAETTLDQVKKRLGLLLSNLPQEEAKEAIEYLLDEYLYTTYGVRVIKELEGFKDVIDSKVQVIQNHRDKCILISQYGFELTGSITFQGKTKLILEERTRDECLEHFDLSVS